jgi:hypothetical protein
MLLALSAVLALAAFRPYQLEKTRSGPDTTVDSRTRSEVIRGVLRRIEEGYVFPRKAAEMEQAVRARAQRGEYDSIVSPEALARRLTGDLRAVSHDLHLEVVYDSKGVVDEGSGGDPSPADQSQLKLYGRRINWGMERVERLKGNVGYLQIRSFNFDASLVDSTLAAAMSFLAGTDALIVDVRNNGGGEPSYVARVCSYFLPPNTLINKFYWRPQNRWDEFRTSRVSGSYYGTARPVYVLTSDQTFSGAEEFAYDVQTQRRGEIVGDTTGGGAHPGSLRRVTEKFGVWVPAGRAVNPVTGTNWEGKGVIPDVPVAADAALRVAHLRALQKILATERDADRRAALRQVIDEISKGP